MRPLTVTAAFLITLFATHAAAAFSVGSDYHNSQNVELLTLRVADYHGKNHQVLKQPYTYHEVEPERYHGDYHRPHHGI